MADSLSEEFHVKKAQGSFSSEQVLDERKECFTWLSIRSRTSFLRQLSFFSIVFMSQ